MKINSIGVSILIVSIFVFTSLGVYFSYSHSRGMPESVQVTPTDSKKYSSDTAVNTSKHEESISLTNIPSIKREKEATPEAPALEKKLPPESEDSWILKSINSCRETEYLVTKSDSASLSKNMHIHICNEVFSVVTWEKVEKNATTTYGMVGNYAYKCHCHDDIGYFNIKDLHTDGGVTKLPADSLVVYKKDDPSFSFSVESLSGLSKLILIGSEKVSENEYSIIYYSYDPITKEKGLLHTFAPNTSFSSDGDDIFSDTEFTVLDENHFSVKTWYDKNTEGVYQKSKLETISL